MAAHSFSDLSRHVGHSIEVVAYGFDDEPMNVSAECVDCCEVLLDFDNERMK